MGSKSRETIHTKSWDRLVRPIIYASPVRVLVATLVSLLLVEIAILAFHFLLPSFGLLADIAVDLLLFVFLVAPVLFVFLINPLLNLLARHEQALAELDQAREELESRVSERTAALVQSNESLTSQIRARELAEEALREKESHLRLLVEQAPAILWSTGLDLTITSLMGAGLADIQMEPARMIGKHVSELAGTDDQDGAALRAHRSALAGGACQYDSQRGGLFLHNMVEPLRDGAGMIIGCLGIGVNVTPLRQANVQINLQMAALESAVDGIVITDRDGVIEWCNPSMTRITGYPLDELIGRKTSLLKSGQHPPSFYAGLWDTILSGKAWQGVMQNRRKDGSYYYEEQAITPVPGPDGQVSRFVAVKHDITERKQNEENLLLHNWELQTLNDISGQVNESLSSAKIYSSLSRLLAKAVPNQGGAIFSAAQDGQAVVESAWDAAGRWFEHTSAAVPASIQAQVERALIERQVIFFEDPPGAHVITPFLFDEQALGVLWLAFDSLAGKHAHFYEALGLQVGVGLKNAFLYQQEIQSRQMAEIMSSASQTLVQTLSPDKVLLMMLELLGQAIPFDCARVLLREDHHRLGLRAGINQSGETYFVDDPPSRAYPPGQHPLYQKIITSRQAVSIPDLCEMEQRQLLTDWPEARSWMGVPVLAGGNLIGVCAIESKAASRFSASHQVTACLVVGQAAVALQNAWLFNQLNEGRTQLQSLSRRLVDIQESERRFIARELHDETSQAVVNLKFGLDMLNQDIGRPDAVRAGVMELEQMVDEILQNLHQLATNLRPAALDHLGLAPALRQLVANFVDKYGITVMMSVEDLSARPGSGVETNLYRIVQEALNNIIRHANASLVEIALNEGEEHLTITIQDNGKGFDPALITQTSRMGILGMRERTEMLGGQFQIFSAPGRGTKIVVEVPRADSTVNR